MYTGPAAASTPDREAACSPATASTRIGATSPRGPSWSNTSGASACGSTWSTSAFPRA